MGVRFTEEQQQVIDLRDRNLLVSAAAGSGKTAVLVERIITRLVKDEPPIDVDRLLVVTYTEAAAAEMRERIRAAIEQALEADPDNVHLQRQSTLIHHAQVTTIHSFCLSVIREYFHTIDLDPSLRVGEEGELKLLKHDVLEEVLEAWYEKGTEGFLNFVESFSYGRDDKQLNELILKLYEYANSYPNPRHWFESCLKQYEISSPETFSESALAQTIQKDAQCRLADLEEKLRFAKELCEEEGGPFFYGEAIASDLKQIEKFRECDGFAALNEALPSMSWLRLSSARKAEFSEEKRDSVKAIRKECKDLFEKLVQDYFYDTTEKLWEELVSAKTNMQVLAQLVQEFGEAYRAKKLSKNLIDFGDMEHYALQILTEEKDGELVPTAVAKEYQERFAEIMIDEYQDSNFVQDAILGSVSTVSQGKPNVFMVGDVKQSIYRFRLSRPELFMSKYASYSATDGPMQKIDLHKNFRSRGEVLRATNFIFEQIMTEEFGGIAYDDNAALYVGADYSEQEGNETELLLVDAAEMEAGENAKTLEASAIANRIKELVGRHPIWDKESQSYRKLRYSDIVILLRGVKDWADVFLEEFAKVGVPAYSASGEGYFETREIRMLLDYLRILDNPRQDLPFAAVLTSPFVGLCNEELAKIQNFAKKAEARKTFYEKARLYAEAGTEEVLQEKLKLFFASYEEIRKMVPYTAMHSLLWTIIEQTGYGNYVAALPAGQQRAANVAMLIEKAIRFENTSYKGLFQFVRYIEQLEKYEVDFGEASVLEETTDVVRLMSIHKSKGLEFPLVFVAGLNRSFSTKDTSASVVIHPEFGVGLDAVDLELRTKTPTLLKRMIQWEVRKESVAEELRILYVAMTRAKEKLILTGVVKNLEKELGRCQMLRGRKQTQLPYAYIAEARKYLDWIFPAIYRNPFAKDIPVRVSIVDKGAQLAQAFEEAVTDGVSKEILQRWDTELVYDAQLKSDLEAQLGYAYPYEAGQKTKQKLSVSELKKRIYLEAEELEEEEVIPLLPKFLQEETGVSGAARGTAYHKVLECLDFAQAFDLEAVRKAIGSMVTEGILEQVQADCVCAEDILHFLQSGIGKRMQLACQRGKYHAEQPFVLGEEDVPGGAEGELTLVQGIIDVWFEEDGELVVLDYKTDRVRQVEELKEKYWLQLDYYARALSRMTGKRVKERIIYSFALQEEIQLRDE
ncbi:MAG: helicase-exonuclease AddAB subunit AddA [Faecalimonas sp.]|nr:helicase-exonuclease AddAB subunit AddA [Faecalimonas sp.]